MQRAVKEISPDLICLQETFLSAEVRARLATYQYPAVRRDRRYEDGGGVMIFIQKQVSYIEVELQTSMEVVAIQVIMNNQKLTVSSLCIPPDYRADQLEKHYKQILRQLPHPYIICADSNAHHTAWGSDESDAKRKMQMELIEEEDLMIINNGEPTYLTNSGNFTYIDLTISSKDIATAFNWNSHHDFLDSDHCPIIIQTAVGMVETQVQHRWKMKEANWDTYQQVLKIPKIYDDANDACKRVVEAAEEAIPNTQHRQEKAYKLLVDSRVHSCEEGEKCFINTLEASKRSWRLVDSI